MSQEQMADLKSWWEQQTFPGKELFRLDDDGSLVLCAHINIKERTVANLALENSEVVIKNLHEKFAIAEGKVKDVEIEWLETKDKLKLSDKVAAVKEYLA